MKSILPWLCLCVVIGVVGASGFIANACIFWHSRRCCCVEPNSPKQVAQKSIDEEISELFASKRFSPSRIPKGVFSTNVVEPFLVTVEWSKIKTALEKLLQSRLKLKDSLSLSLYLEIPDKNNSKQLRFVMAEPPDAGVKSILMRTLQLPDDFFDKKLKIAGETRSVALGEFERRFLSGNQLDLQKVQASLQDLLTDNKRLKAAATAVGGEFKPIDVPEERTAERLLVLTAWQFYAGTEDVRRYWRGSIKVSKQADAWQLETLIEFGERYRSESSDDIRLVQNSNAVGEFEYTPTVGAIGGQLAPVNQVTFKVVSSTDAIMDVERSSPLAKLARNLWIQVRRELLVVKPEEPADGQK